MLTFIEFITEQESFKSWFRKNASYRGLKNDDTGGGGAMLGRGLYTAALSNKSLAKEYGEVKILIGARPKNPLRFKDLNQFEIWCQKNLYMLYPEGEFPSKRNFFKNDTIEDAVQKMGYDGIEIIGREYVNFKPDKDSIRYFSNRLQAELYFNDFIKS